MNSKIKIEHIEKLSKGKKSGIKIGSRGIPHHLYKFEDEKYKRALQYRFLEITNKDRVNLQNIWDKVCQAKDWENYTLIKNLESGTSVILHNQEEIFSGETAEMKKQIRSLSR